jgi:hypothetical protein
LTDKETKREENTQRRRTRRKDTRHKTMELQTANKLQTKGQ